MKRSLHLLSCANMIGPLLSMELVTGNRRGKLALLRYAYGGWLVLQFLFLCLTSVLAESITPGQGKIGGFINSYLDTLVKQHFFLMVLVTPAFVAGAIADEKARGTLQFLLTAQLTDREIVAGKYLGRLAQVGLLALTPLPIVAALAGLSALAPLALVALAGVSIIPLLGVGAFSLLSSVWSTQSRDAVLRVYLCLALGWVIVSTLRDDYLDPILSPWAGTGGVRGTPAWLLNVHEALSSLSPIYVLDAAWGEDHPRVLLSRLFWSGLGWGSMTVPCLALAIWRLRPAYQHQVEAGGRTWFGVARDHAPIGDRPIAWKEREIEGIAPFKVLRRCPRPVAMLLVGAVALALVIAVNESYEPLVLLALQSTGVGFVGNLLVGVRSSGAICAERERQTWDSLLLAPLSLAEIIGEKHRGVLQSTYPYLAAYSLPTFAARAC